jgi:hypothetical protein
MMGARSPLNNYQLSNVDSGAVCYMGKAWWAGCGEVKRIDCVVELVSFMCLSKLQEGRPQIAHENT